MTDYDNLLSDADSTMVGTALEARGLISLRGYEPAPVPAFAYEEAKRCALRAINTAVSRAAGGSHVNSKAAAYEYALLVACGYASLLDEDDDVSLRLGEALDVLEGHPDVSTVLYGGDYL